MNVLLWLTSEQLCGERVRSSAARTGISCCPRGRYPWQCSTVGGGPNQGSSPSWPGTCVWGDRRGLKDLKPQHLPVPTIRIHCSRKCLESKNYQNQQSHLSKVDQNFIEMHGFFDVYICQVVDLGTEPELLYVSRTS